MSVINQMLRDLESRRRREQAQRHGIKAVMPQRAGSRIGWFLLIIMAVVGGVYLGSLLPLTGTDGGTSSAATTPLSPPASTDTAAQPAARHTNDTASSPASKHAASTQKTAATTQASKHPNNAAANKTTRNTATHTAASTSSARPAHPPASAHNTARATAPKPAPVRSHTTQASVHHTEAPTPVPVLTGTNTDTGPGQMHKTRHRATSAEQAAIAYRKGLAAQSAGQAHAAEAQFKAALAADPSDQKARDALAQLYVKTRQYDAAQVVYLRGIAQDPAHSEHYQQRRVRILATLGYTQKAIDALTQSHPKAQQNPEHYALLGVLYSRQKDYAKAVTNYQKAVKAHANNGRWWAGLAIAYEQQGQNQNARHAYQRAKHNGGLGTTLSQYVNKRIQALATQRH